ncbi:MAG: hypothetical protein Q4A11_07250 [Brachymonas sp.]|nr:hypothetical protein [Brachymonas sp.]
MAQAISLMMRQAPARFHAGQTVTVHFNPAQPAQTAGILRFFDICLGGWILGHHALLQWLHGM